MKRACIVCGARCGSQDEVGGRGASGIHYCSTECGLVFRRIASATKTRAAENLTIRSRGFGRTKLAAEWVLHQTEGAR